MDGLAAAVQLYGEDLLMTTVTDCAKHDPKQLVDDIASSVRNHAAGAPVSDDITILALRYRRSA